MMNIPGDLLGKDCAMRVAVQLFCSIEGPAASLGE